MTTWCTLAPSQVWRVVDFYSSWSPPAVMTTWTLATATCTWSVEFLIQMARTSRPWKLMLPGGQHGQQGFFVHQTNPYQGPHQPGEQLSLHQHLAKESLQLRTYRTEFSLPGCQWTPTTGPALAARLYARPLCETFHALLKFSGMYPSYWSNRMSVEHFVGGIMLLSWDLMPDDSNGVAYLSPKHLSTVKASLRFAKLLLATTTLIAYAQYDNLVVVDAYQCLHHWHLPAWFPAAYLINTARGGDAGEH